MVYFIAQGTIGGHHCFPQEPPANDIRDIILDIRNEINPNALSGYYIQMSHNGVWISIGKGMDDGERNGNGAGYMAFSVYIPSDVILPGDKIKQKLDQLMSFYIKTYTDGIYTRSKGVDWSFVEMATAELNAISRNRNKCLQTHKVSSNKFAYIQVDDENKVTQYFEKPFQPEYGEFNAVFIGTQLLNSGSLSSLTPIDIDLENEAYDVIWLGDTHDYPFLPKTVRKNQIDKLSLNFHRKHYESRDIFLSEGIVDDVNATVTIQIPQLDPISYSLKFIINHPEAVKTITATSNSSKTPLVSADNETLEFIGAQVEKLWHISIRTNDNFQTQEIDIVPFDNIGNGCEISLVEIQLIKVQIKFDGQIDTGNQRHKVKFFNKQTYTSERGEYNNASNSVDFRIPVTVDFESIYSITLQEIYINDYKLSVERIPIPGYIVVNIKKRINSQVLEQETTKLFRVYVPNQYADSSISCLYHRKSSILTNGSTSQQCTVYEIKVPKDLHRYEITFYLDNKPLKARIANEDRSTIDIQGFVSIWDALTYKIGKYKPLVLISSIALLFVILLACATIFTLNSLDFIEVKDWFRKNDTTAISGDNSNAGGQGYDSQTQSAYKELSQVLENQKDTWNYDAIYNSVDKYAHTNADADSLRRNDSAAYVMLKKLSWLYRTRDIVNKREFAKLPALVKVDNDNFNDKWRLYIDNNKITFLRDLINPSNARALGKLKNKIKEDKAFKDKKYSEIVIIWETCKQEVVTPTVVRPENNDTQPESGRGNEMEDAGNF